MDSTDLLIFLIFVFGILVGWKLREWAAVRAVNNMIRMAEEIEHTEKEQEDTVLQIKVEQHENMFLVYNEDSGDFMAQGNTFEDAQEALIKRYPNNKFIIKEDNARAMGINL